MDLFTPAASELDRRSERWLGVCSLSAKQADARKVIELADGDELPAVEPGFISTALAVQVSTALAVNDKAKVVHLHGWLHRRRSGGGYGDLVALRLVAVALLATQAPLRRPSYLTGRELHQTVAIDTFRKRSG